MRLNKYSVILAVAFLSIGLPLVFRPYIDIFDSLDESVFHYPTILTFAEQFPKIDLVNYELAMTPLYPIVMMLLMKIFGLNLIYLRIINLLISLICLLLVNQYLLKKLSPAKAFLLSLCFMLSPYFIGASVRLSTETMGLLLCFATMMTLEKADTFTHRKFLLASLLTTLCVLTRQVHAWLIVVGLYYAFVYGQDKTMAMKIKNSLFFVIPIAGLAPFLIIWGGVTTPVFAESYQRETLINLDVFVYAVSVFGMLGVFFVFWYLRYFAENGGKLWHPALIFSFTALFLIVRPVINAYDQAPWTGGGALWKLSTYLPNIHSTAVSFWILFPLGLFFFYALFLNQRRNKDYFIVICAVLWLAANLFSGLTFQKYYEPFLLFLIGYSLSGIRSEPSYYWAGPASLLVIFAVVDLFRFFL